jgi:hypothetical protein
MKSNPLILLALCLFFLCTTGYQAVMASRLATESVQAYAPMVEQQAVATIIEELPSTENGKKATYLAQSLAMNVESQYVALSSAVNSQSRVLIQQTVCWAVASIFALVVYIESRRKAASAA